MRHTKHHAFLFVNGCVLFIAVQDERDLHRRVAYAFVAVDEWMIGAKKVSKCGSFADHPGIELFATERLVGLRYCRLKQSRVTNTARTTRCGNDAFMYLDDAATER